MAVVIVFFENNIAFILVVGYRFCLQAAIFGSLLYWVSSWLLSVFHFPLGIDFFVT